MDKSPKKLPPLIVILGTTASGKSALAVLIARLVDGEVVSADSRQVYRGLDIGSGKITKREMRGVPHHLLSVANSKRQFSVAEYKKLADRVIEGIVKRGKVPILCGGTGFYIDAVAENRETPEVPPNHALRKKLAGKSASELYKTLQKLDSTRAQTVERQNPRRLVRAIEIAKALGKVPKTKNGEKRYDALYIGLNPDEKTLRKNIHARLLARMKKGMLAEVKRLHENGIAWKRLEEFGLEYKYLALYLQKKITKEETLREIETKSWQFARRQRTWFKRNKNIRWFPNSKSAREFLSKAPKPIE